MSVTPACPECRAATVSIQAEGEDLFRCPACGRRTYGTGDPDDDDALPPYTETDESGAVFVHRGTGEVDVEATAEVAAQEGPGEDDDLGAEEPPAPAAPVVGHGAPAGRGTTPVPGDAPADLDLDPAATLTDRNGGAGHEEPVPHLAPGHGRTASCPNPSPVGHE